MPESFEPTSERTVLCLDNLYINSHFSSCGIIIEPSEISNKSILRKLTEIQN